MTHTWSTATTAGGTTAGASTAGITRRAALAATASAGLLAAAVARAEPARAATGSGAGPSAGGSWHPTTASSPFGTTQGGEAVERWTRCTVAPTGSTSASGPPRPSTATARPASGSAS